MKVSIIIPVYNVSHYIKRCLQSVIDQTAIDFECILVDDCGNDNSIELAQDFINDYKGDVPFTIIHHDKNMGLSAARNTGLNHSKGEYVFFLDGDDTITIDCIENLMNLAAKHPNADFVQGNFIDEKGNINKFGWYTHLPEYCDNHEKLELFTLSIVVTSACNKVIKKSFINEYKLFFPEGIIHEDMYWSFFLAKHTKAAAYFNEGTYIYYINDNSIVTSISHQARIKRYTSRLYASEAFCIDLDKEQKATKCQRHYIAGNLTSAMIELAALHSFHHWYIFWKHVCKIYATHTKLTFGQHVLFLFMMPPLCFPIGIKAWYWRVQRYIVNNI